MNLARLEKEKLMLLKTIKILSLILLLASVVITAFSVYFLKEQGLLNISEKSSVLNIPYFTEVNNIISPLRYSGIPMLAGRDVYLSLNFDVKRWILHNVHKFDEKGELVLEENKYGTCGELAAYTAAKIRPFLKNKYKIKFLKACQSGYFFAPKASHIVLRITSKANEKEVYILDPSFHRYGPINEFGEYWFFEEMDALEFLENKLTDIEVPINLIIPLLIKDSYLLGLTVGGTDWEFENRNFTLVLTLTKKYDYNRREIFAIGSINGNTEIRENKELAREVLDEREWSILKQKITELFNREINPLRAQDR